MRKNWAFSIAPTATSKWVAAMISIMFIYFALGLLRARGLNDPRSYAAAFEFEIEIADLLSPEFFQAVGLAGFLIYVGVFAAVQFGAMNGNGIAYSVWNVLAATFVAVSLTTEFNLASALIQGSWIVIGLGGLIIRVARLYLNGCGERA